MNDFLLRIFFSGLVAFVSSPDGKELTVLLLETHGHTVSDGTPLAHHKPVLLARAQDCTGDCNRQDAAIAAFFYADRPASQAADGLAAALQGGGAWDLANSELLVRSSGKATLPPLSLHKSLAVTKSDPKKMTPASSDERKDFGWVADLKKILPSFGEFNPALFGPRPPKGIVAARLRLTSGHVFTRSLIRVDDKVQPIHFRARGSKSDAGYAQAVANWVEAEIRVPGDSIELVARDFDTGTERSMTLTPQNGVVEIAVVNLPPFEVPGAGAPRPTPQPGNHFEAFYDLAKNPPAANQRPVPLVRAAKAQTDWQSVHPRQTLWSALLDRLRLDAGRGPYDVLLCPVGQGGQP